MQIAPDFKLRTVAGETIIVQQGAEGTDLTRIISLNASACLLYQQLAGQDFSTEDAARLLSETYGIDKVRAAHDAAAWIAALKECRIIIDTPFAGD